MDEPEWFRKLFLLTLKKVCGPTGWRRYRHLAVAQMAVLNPVKVHA